MTKCKLGQYAFECDGETRCADREKGTLPAGHCGFGKVPEWVGELDWVRKAWLGGNGIEEVEPLSGLEGLEVLDLRMNAIRDPSGLRGLDNLEELYLHGNEISGLRGLERLGSLRVLDLSHNAVGPLERLRGLERLRDLPDLEEVNLQGQRAAYPFEVSGRARLCSR
jgi:hypothetical protein